MRADGSIRPHSSGKGCLQSDQVAEELVPAIIMLAELGDVTVIGDEDGLCRRISADQ